MSNQLLPCPFCDGQSRVAQSDTVFWVKCGKCEAEGPTDANEKKAVEAWNRRVTQPAAGEPVGKIVAFGESLHEVSWHKGKLPALGTELFANAPPAAAHGDEATRVKLCEAYESGYQDGQKWPDSYSIQADKDKVADALIAAMRAQAGEGDNHA